jgi:DnaK suppressor protein
MNTQQYRTTLVAKTDELRSRKIRLEDIAVEKNADALDHIQQAADRVLAFDSVGRNWQMSSLISEALARIEKNTYGLCADCGEDISEKRLAALPWAKYCIGCQEAADNLSPSLRNAA